MPQSGCSRFPSRQTGPRIAQALTTGEIWEMLGSAGQPASAPMLVPARRCVAVRAPCASSRAKEWLLRDQIAFELGGSVHLLIRQGWNCRSWQSLDHGASIARQEDC